MVRVYWFQTATTEDLQMISAKVLFWFMAKLCLRIRKGLFKRETLHLTSAMDLRNYLKENYDEPIILYMKQIGTTLIPLTPQEDHQAQVLASQLLKSI